MRESEDRGGNWKGNRKQEAVGTPRKFLNPYLNIHEHPKKIEKHLFDSCFTTRISLFIYEISPALPLMIDDGFQRSTGL